VQSDSVSRAEFETLKRAVDVLLAEVRTLRGESDQRRQEKTARQVRYENRRALLRQIADACGPISWDTAETVRQVLLGELPAPRGQERVVQRLLQDDETPRSQGRIWDAIKPAELTRLPPSGVSGGVQNIIDHLQRRGDDDATSSRQRD
jgi:hypothetical protein